MSRRRSGGGPIVELEGVATTVVLSIPPFANTVPAGEAQRAPSFTLPDASLVLRPRPYHLASLVVTYALVPEDARVAHPPVTMVLAANDMPAADAAVTTGAGPRTVALDSLSPAGHTGSSAPRSGAQRSLWTAGKSVSEAVFHHDSPDIRVPVFLRLDGSRFRLVFTITPLHAPPIVLATDAFVLRRDVPSSARLDAPSPALARVSFAPAWVRLAALHVVKDVPPPRAPDSAAAAALADPDRRAVLAADAAHASARTWVAASSQPQCTAPRLGLASLDDDVASMLAFDTARASSSTLASRPSYDQLRLHESESSSRGSDPVSAPDELLKAMEVPGSPIGQRLGYDTLSAPAHTPYDTTSASTFPSASSPSTASTTSGITSGGWSSFVSGFALGLICGTILTAQASTPYAPPKSLFHIRGEYASYIRLNFEGSPLADFIRDNLAVDDSNCFVTMFVVQALLDARPFLPAELQSTGPLAPEAIDAAVEAVVGFADKNKLFSGSMVFWPQSPSPVNASIFEASPPNLFGVIDGGRDAADAVERLLSALHLKALLPYAEEIADAITNSAAAFRIPSDFDDSALNILLGAMLAETDGPFSSAEASWRRHNPSPVAWADLIVRYAYRPHANTTHAGLIDPRTYYFAHEFLTSQAAKNISLIPTWVMDLQLDKELLAARVTMPFNVNNVDCTVIANNLISMTYAALADFDIASSWFSHELQSIYADSAAYLAWAISSGRVDERPDLGLTYYPSVETMLWFVSRSVHALSSAPAPRPFPVLETVADLLTPAFRGPATDKLLATATVAPDDGGLYWDGFLGDGGKKPHGNDRVFTTATVVHALINGWSVSPQRGALALVAHTPSKVLAAIRGGLAWLAHNGLPHRTKAQNAFFSGSVKGMDLPFFFPSNYNAFLNGTTVDPHTAPDSALTDELVCAMEGVVPKHSYATMLNTTFYGEHVPPYTGFAHEGSFPFWSSPPMTYAQVLVVLAKAAALDLEPP
ncbi:uncharacterized protein AMSG_03090 [Thecamonas trahens ATCC 50062]|uniref:Uncharacterized protein n=1 Tax=Thecamonas trahens ATCC 50062 TaxID=461836 RepID=A0A0L0D5S4_THETB|nr:hypothetical protein AMSG_03090 [Thecamonas trahens ATCC 50062]KNC46653.1 hypothetical protein AMSG_03090 [Thecamonas trahens ATCC 50062]|eukprot:XP_013760426.1 hypothetical protein AMSG_03090 [Thecamonas trahens ATCC 50062]